MCKELAALVAVTLAISACEPGAPGADGGADVPRFDAAVVCGTTCASVQACCATSMGNQCVDIFTSPMNCGGCGRACGAGDVCVSGSCVPLGPSDTGPPDARRSDAGADPLCSPACGAGFMCCEMRCVSRDGAGGAEDLSFAHCGGCGSACSATTADHCGQLGMVTACMCNTGPACPAGQTCTFDAAGMEVGCR